MNMSGKDFVHEWCEFGDHRTYLLWLIARRKHNEELTNSTEIVHRRVLSNEKEIDDNYDDLVALASRHDYRFRLYLTVNARNAVEAQRRLDDKMNEWLTALIYGDEDQAKKMHRIGSEWKSCLHSPKCRDDEYFAFDVDDNPSESEIESFIEDLSEQTTVLTSRSTPNGYHVITEPFNYTEWEPPIEYDELDTDGQIFVAELDESE